jgi:hypothetical protein
VGTLTLLQTCTAALDEAGFDAPSYLFTNPDDTAKRVLRAAQREGESLAQPDGKPWNILVKEHTFVTVSGTQTYALPEDFRYMLSDTQWDRSQRRRMLPVTSAEWQYLKGWTTSAFGLNWRFRLRNGALEIEQDVTVNGNTIAYEYISRYYVVASGGTSPTKASFTIDSDAHVFDDELFVLGVKWRFRQALGFDFEADLAEYLGERSKRLARDGGIPTLRMNGRAGGVLGINVPDQNYGG